jgi:hypothetical protein
MHWWASICCAFFSRCLAALRKMEDFSASVFYRCFPRMNGLESESYFTTDGQPASLSRNKAPIWGLWPDLCYCQTLAGLLMWGALSDERTDLSFAIAIVTLQRSHFRVRVPWDSSSYFTASDSKLPFSSPLTNRRAALEVLDPAYTRDNELESESCITTDGQSASLSWNKAPIWGLRPDLYYCQTVACLLMWGAVSDERTGLSFTIVAGLR